MCSATGGPHCVLYRWRCCVCRTSSCGIRRTRLACHLHNLQLHNGIKYSILILLYPMHFQFIMSSCEFPIVEICSLIIEEPVKVSITSCQWIIALLRRLRRLFSRIINVSPSGHTRSSLVSPVVLETSVCLLSISSPSVVSRPLIGCSNTP